MLYHWHLCPALHRHAQDLLPSRPPRCRPPNPPVDLTLPNAALMLARCLLDACSGSSMTPMPRIRNIVLPTLIRPCITSPRHTPRYVSLSYLALPYPPTPCIAIPRHTLHCLTPAHPALPFPVTHTLPQTGFILCCRLQNTYGVCYVFCPVSSRRT